MDRPPFHPDDVTETDASTVRVRDASHSENTALAFRAFLEALALPAWIFDSETRRILAVNDALVDLTQRPRDALLTLKVYDLFTADSRETAYAQMQAETENSQHRGNLVRMLAHRSLPIEVRVVSRPAPAVHTNARLAIAHEVPADRVAASAPRSEAPSSRNDLRWRTFVEMSPLPAGIVLVDRETNRAVAFMAINDALSEATGFTREELLRMPPLDLIHENDRQALARDIARQNTRASKLDWRTYRHLRKDGSYFEVHLGSVSIDFEGEKARVTVLTDVSAKSRAETATAQSEERYRTLFEVCPVATCVYDLTTLQFVAINDAMVRLYGYRREDILNMGVLDLVAPDDADLVIGQIEELRRGNNARVLHRAYTVRHRLATGEEIDVELIEAPLLYGGSRARLVMHQDVTEHKRAQAELVKRARIETFRAELGTAMMADESLPAHFERVTEAMIGHLDVDSAGIWILDEASGQLELQANAGNLDIATAGGKRLRFGETWIGRAASRAAPVLLDTIDPAMRPMEVTYAQRHGISSVCAFPCIARGRVIGVLSAGCSHSFAEEVVNILRATAAQIAQSVGAAFAYEALRVSESLSRSVLANMLSPLVTISEEGIVETANAAATATFGYSRDELIGKPFSALFEAKSRDQRQLLQRLQGRVSEEDGKKKSGEVFKCEVRLFHLESLRGPGYAAILHDLSERYEVERLKAEFVSVVSHELRTPLTALRGSIGLLAGGVMGTFNTDVTEMLEIADRNIRRLITLVNDILELERMQQTKLTLVIRPVRALSIVERSLEVVRSFADQERIVIDVRCTDDLVQGDDDRLVQVLVNLLSNAVKFSPAGSRVEVSNEVEANTIVFRVKDRGRGIPASHRRTIFERFAQVHTDDSREKGGSGLGLTISKTIVERHDGTIGVDSEEGRGSTFWFRVPRAFLPLPP
ncbi:MAG: PAS domain S-box protein [Polyangiaceae bacterium]|nr:PAS domain S-box protein [Polyangiaceae bacterium]